MIYMRYVYVCKRLNTFATHCTWLAVCRPCTGEQCELRGARQTTKARVQIEEKCIEDRVECTRRDKKEEGGRGGDTYLRFRQFASSHSIREQFCQWLYILSSYRFVDFTSTTAALYIDKHIHTRTYVHVNTIDVN